MGILKAKGSSRAERRAVFSPFRRLSNIAEEGDDNTDFSKDDNKRLQNTPNRLKLTPNRPNHRFQKLVEYDYGDHDKQYYEPPQDFLSVQQKTKEKKAETNKLSIRKELKEDPSTPNKDPSKTLFQLAAVTASLSKSCSSDSSSVSGSHASSSKRSFQASFGGIDTNDNGSNDPSFFKSTLEKSFSSAPEAREFQQTSNGTASDHIAHNTCFPDDKTTNDEAFPNVPNDAFTHFACNFPLTEEDNTSCSQIIVFDNVEWPTTNSFDSQRPKAFEVKRSNTVDSSLTGSATAVDDCVSWVSKESDCRVKQNIHRINRRKENESMASILRDSTHNSRKVQFSHEHEVVRARKKTRFSQELVGKKKTDSKVARRVPTPGRGNESRSNASFDFESKMSDVSPVGSQVPETAFSKKSVDLSSAENHHSSAGGSYVSNKRSIFARINTLGAIPRSTSTYVSHDKTNGYDETVSRSSTYDSCDTNSTATSASTFVDASPTGIRGGFPTPIAPTFSSMSSSAGSASLGSQIKSYNSTSHNVCTGNMARPPTAVPPTSILGSMLFQSGEVQATTTTSTAKSRSLKNGHCVQYVPQSIKEMDDDKISDVTGSTAASEWMVQGNKLLNRYYYNSQDGISQKKQKVSRQLRKREEQNFEEYHSMVAGLQHERKRQSNKNRISEFASDFNNQGMTGRQYHRRHHDADSIRKVRSGFDNLDDDDANSLFEA